MVGGWKLRSSVPHEKMPCPPAGMLSLLVRRTARASCRIALLIRRYVLTRGRLRVNRVLRSLILFRRCPPLPTSRYLPNLVLPKTQTDTAL
jgi:hypothetical protein